jgi:hypothetical protein
MARSGISRDCGQFLGSKPGALQAEHALGQQPISYGQTALKASAVSTTESLGEDD